MSNSTAIRLVAGTSPMPPSLTNTAAMQMIHAMAAWVELLREAVRTEFGARPVIATLATVDTQARPRARCVVIRQIHDSGELLITADARGAKHEQLLHQSQAAMVLWLPTLRAQFRIDGPVRFDDGAAPRRLQVWKDLSDASRATFFWPPPGQPKLLSEDDFARDIGAAVPPPANFELLILKAAEVDRLDLNPHPHRRQKWSADQNWQSQELNP